MGRRREAPRAALHERDQGVLKLDVDERPDREPPPPVEPDGHPPVQPAHGRGRAGRPADHRRVAGRLGPARHRRPGSATASRGWRACGRAPATRRRRGRNLDIYLRAFILRNGFHANGDQLKAGLLVVHLPPVHARGQLPRRAGGARDAAPDLEPDGRASRTPRSSASSRPCRRTGPTRRSTTCAPRAGTGSPRAARAAGRRGSGSSPGRTASSASATPSAAGKIQWSKAGRAKVGENFEVTLKRGETLEAAIGGQ